MARKVEFLYVEVPPPRKRATSIRTAANYDSDDNHSQTSKAPSKTTVSVPASQSSNKGKERERVNGEAGSSARNSPSPALLDQARSGPSTSTTRTEDPQTSSAGASSSATVRQSNGTGLSAPSLKTTGSSSSSTLSSVKQGTTEGSGSPPTMARSNGHSLHTRRKRKIVIQESDDSSGEMGALGSSALPPRRKARQRSNQKQQTNGSISSKVFPDTEDEVEYTPLGVDEEIVKVLGRKKYGSHFAYAVKLKDRSKVFVVDTALDQSPDLLEEFTDLQGSGWREDGKIHTDSESDGESKATDDASDDSDAYSEGGKEGNQGDAESDGDMDVDTSDDGASISSDDVPLQQQATRKSNREAAQKKIDYNKQAEYNEEDEESDESDESDDSDDDSSSSDEVPLSKQRRASSDSDFEVVSGPSTFKGKGKSPSTKMIVDGLTEEEFIEGGVREEDLRPEQFHCPDCSKCGDSSARVSLPEYIKKEKRKRKKQAEEGEFDASSIKEYGCWIHCEICSGSWHWKCLPGGSSALGMKVVFKKMVDAKYGTGAHLNINNTYKIASCPDCLKPEGTSCKFCLEKEPVHDITKGIESTFGPSNNQAAPSSTRTAEELATSTAKGKGREKEKGATEEAAAENAISEDATMAEDTPTKEDKHLLFRCTQCRRTAHYSCIPIPNPADKWQYSWEWHCDDCKNWGPIDAVLAWRPLDWNKRNLDKEGTPPPSSPKRIAPSSPGKAPAVTVEIPDHKAPWWNAEYLVKFKETSFRKATWVPHSWLFSAYKQRLRNFLVDGPLIDIKPDNATRDGEDDVEEDHLENFSLQPTPNAFDLIPKEWLTPDRILDVRLRRKSGGGNDPRVMNMKNRITNDPEDTFSRVTEMYVKWQGLPYESATWETDLPEPDGPQYEHFIRAYGEYLKFRDVEIPRPSQKELAILDRARPKSQFAELTEQPDFITLGKLMDFQLLGVSWLYYNWWVKKGCILADEMGLGKTVQIISFLSILFRTENCKPFLVVVPNSTLQNWQREFSKWAPDDMRVVPYYGSRASRRIIEEFELFSEGSVSEQRLRTHVVLTTYECIVADPAIFKRVPRWEALIVDEAQRLKSGPKNLLWKALQTLRFGHTVLLTGTPVNNNLDELFNLLSFLDPASFRNLDELHNRYENLTPELVAEVQGIAQPYFLRRTKEAVLNLPPLSEVIIPVSMSQLQKVVYKSVLEKNMDALKAIYDASKAKTKKKVVTGKVTNVLMELRKTLCHPYLVRDELEHDTDLDAKAIHKNLVEASSKLQFLSNFLPKLKERGHRVLLFSQFVIVLNVVERFLEGMKFKFVRLDGNTSQAQRQKFIDAYNAPDSDIFIFILTTRAGGVGINLATADTVILFDADFNPFQDLQAISRAHRIGQTRKVMCFKLMVKGTCEEKIIETGKKKMVLEQLIVDSKDLKNSEDEEAVNNVESLLLFGAQALFSEEPDAAAQNEISYSERDIDDLITKTENEEVSAEEVEAKKIRTIEANKAFSYARVWEQQARAEDQEADKRELEAQRGFWSKIIETKEKEKKDEELARQLQMGRGYRRRQQTNYNHYNAYGDMFSGSPATSRAGNKDISDSDDDDDFDAAMASDDSDADEGVPAQLDAEDLAGLDIHKNKRAKIMPHPAPNGQQQQQQQQQQNQQPNGHIAPLVPIRPNGPIYTDPHPITIAPDQPPHPRYEIARSPTPPEISEKRTALIQNLLKRAELLQNKDAVNLIREATKANSGTDQVVLCQKATDILKNAIHAGANAQHMNAGPSASTSTSTVVNGNVLIAPKPSTSSNHNTVGSFPSF